MFRALLAILMIVQVAACPFSCAAETGGAQTAIGEAKHPCSCCKDCDSPRHSLPNDKDNDEDVCSCFCNGGATTTASAPHTQDFQPTLTAVIDPNPTPNLAVFAIEGASAPPGDGSGKTIRLAVQSLLL